MIFVVATVDLRPGTRAAFLTEFFKVMPLVWAEAGCIDYRPAVDMASGIAAQPAVREDTVVILETWADLPALQAHLAAPHMTDYRARVKDYVAGVRLEVLQPA